MFFMVLPLALGICLMDINNILRLEIQKRMQSRDEYTVFFVVAISPKEGNVAIHDLTPLGINLPGMQRVTQIQRMELSIDLGIQSA